MPMRRINTIKHDNRPVPAIATLLVGLGARLGGAPLADDERNELLAIVRNSPRPTVQGRVEEALDWLQNRFLPPIIARVPQKRL